MKKKPIRTCCYCRKKMIKDELNRFVWADGEIQIDVGQKMQGRGAYCCVRKECTEGFLRQKKWGRIFRL